MKVLLVQPDSVVAKRSTPEEYRFFCEPLALEYLSSAAESDGHVAPILDCRVDPRSLEQALHEFQPDVVGTTGYSVDVPLMYEICRVAKQWRPQCRTVVGGHHATLRAQDFSAPRWTSSSRVKASTDSPIFWLAWMRGNPPMESTASGLRPTAGSRAET